MTHKYLALLLLTTSVCHAEAASVFNWFWGNTKDDTTVLVADGVPLVAIPYETMTEDEKFLQEAAKFTEIQVSSPLDTCQHKVVMKIKTSCSDMTEEELAKMSVNLLNCQSAVEGRKMFPCTEEMSLKQCTTDMDADMWNAYHLMSNRARALCYATRSTQFRALTELTVNKLMQSAHAQIKALGTLKESQDRLEEQTVEALSSLSDGNKALLEQQQHLKDAQTSAHRLVTTNLRDLNNEKALIRAGHTQLAAMAEDIKRKLEEASQQLLEQAEERDDNHKEILQDLLNIQEQTQLIWQKIESSTDRIIEQHESALDQYDQTLQKLAQINETIQFIHNATNMMRAEIDEKLGWITAYIGDTGEQFQKVYRTALHIVYILVAMIVASFLQAPFLTRATIMGIVPLNLVTYLKHGAEACLDFTSITALIFLITGMHFVMVMIQRALGANTTNIRGKIEETVKVTPENGLSNGDAHNYMSSSYASSVPKVSLWSRLTTTIRDGYSTIIYQANCSIRKMIAAIHSITSMTRQRLTSREELSCSYVASKKPRNNVVYEYTGEYASMSDDLNESSMVNESYDKFEDSDSLLDANELRNRLRKVNRSGSRNSYNHSTPTRSVTPSYAMPRMLCNALTRSGRKCKLYAVNGQHFCSRHTAGSSVMGD